MEQPGFIPIDMRDGEFYDETVDLFARWNKGGNGSLFKMIQEAQINAYERGLNETKRKET